MNNVVLNVDINVDVFEECLTLITFITWLYCKNQCAIKVNVVYVMTYDMSCHISP